MVLAAFLIIKVLLATGNVSSLIKGQLVPICAYIVMALSLNLTVGILGELSLGHAGFMSVGAFSGVVVASSLKNVIPNNTVRLLLALVVAAVIAALVGVLVGIPVLRLRGDYLAIVTLAFGEIIKVIIGNVYIGSDRNGLHFSLVNNTVTLTEGGKMIISGPMGAMGVAPISTFTIGVLLIFVSLLVIFHLVNSKSGRAIMALRDNRIAAESHQHHQIQNDGLCNFGSTCRLGRRTLFTELFDDCCQQV